MPHQAHRPRRQPGPDSTRIGLPNAKHWPCLSRTLCWSPRKATKVRQIGRETPMTACIVGWAHTPFGRLDTESVESLTVRVANEALRDAGIAAADVDEILLGHFNAGFSAQD